MKGLLVVDRRNPDAASECLQKRTEEVHAQSIQLIGPSGPKYPLQKKSTSNEFLRTVAHFRSRSKHGFALSKIRNSLFMAFHEYLQVSNLF